MTTTFNFNHGADAARFYDAVAQDGCFERIGQKDRKVAIVATNTEQVERLAKYKTLAKRKFAVVTILDLTGDFTA